MTTPTYKTIEGEAPHYAVKAYNDLTDNGTFRGIHSRALVAINARGMIHWCLGTKDRGGTFNLWKGAALHSNSAIDWLLAGGYVQLEAGRIIARP